MRPWGWLLGTMVLASCGGGGGDAPAVAPGPAGLTLSGSIDAVQDSRSDHDTNDPLATRTPNDDPGQQQPLPNPATLGGYANAPGAGPAGPSRDAGDEWDSFILPLTQGQNVNLYVADIANGDLDLYLLDSQLQLVDSSEGVGNDETVTAPGDGEYTVLVHAYAGASTYILQVGAGAAAATHGMRYSADFVPGDIMAAFVEERAARTLGPGARERAQRLGLLHQGGAAGRTHLFGLPSAGIPAALEARSPRPRGWDAHLEPHGAKRATLRAIKALAARADVRFAEPNLVRHALATQTDPYYDRQWHYPLINLPQAWDLTLGASSVVVAVVDTGVVLSHPDLAPQLDPQDPDGYDFISNASSARDGNGRDPDADDPGDGLRGGASSFHGTHVAGTVAAASSNGIGVAGVAPAARIMPLRVLGAAGGTSFDIQQAVLYAAGLANDAGVVPANAASVINLSLGGPGSSAAEQQVYTQAIAAGVLVVAAAGNENSTQLSYPASYNGVVSVASVARTKQRAPYSNFNGAVDVAAPGGDMATSVTDGVLSTWANDSSGGIQNGYGYLVGTSMATPHVAGVMALMRAVHPALTQQQFLNLLATGAITEDLGLAGRDNTFGYGLIDAHKAVVAAAELAGGSPVAAAPTLVSSRDSLQFGPSLVTILFDLANAGGGSLTVDAVTDDQPWLTVAPESVRPDGTGRYRATVARGTLAVGLYGGTVTATSSANTVQIPVTLQVAPAAGTADAGYTYVLLLDPATFETLGQVDGPTTGGSLDYAFTGVQAGTYYVVAGNDLDNDGFICGGGEACGMYPTQEAPEPVAVTASRAGLDFLLGFTFAANVSAAEGSPPSPGSQRGWARLR